MLLHGVLKCYVLYILFDLCATVKHQRILNIDKRIRGLRRSLENNEKAAEATILDDDEATILEDEDDSKEKKSHHKNDNNESAAEATILEDENTSKEKQGHDKNKNNESAAEATILEDENTSKEKQSQDKNNNNESAAEATILEDTSKEKQSKEGTWEIKESNSSSKPVEKVMPNLDVSDSSADKILEISKLSAMTGFDYSPAEEEKFKIWPQGIIPFYIDEFSYDKIGRDKLRELLDEASSVTGLRFMELPRPPVDDNTRWVFIINRRGQLNCTDYSPTSFNNTGVQKLVIGYDCIGNPYVAPIVLALAGVPPQHNSPDRDKYIDVSTKSIQPDKVKLFTAVKAEDWLFHDLKYDFLSAGHYPSHKYTVDGSATITPKSKTNNFVGETEGLSYTDVVKIRMLYNLVLEKDDKNAKLPDCKTLYRPGPKFKTTDVLDKHIVSARKKPKKYVEAAKQAGIEIVEGSENRPSVPNDDNTDKESSDDGKGKNKPNNKNNEGSDSGKKGNIAKSLEQAENSSKEMLKDGKRTTSTDNPITLNDDVTSDE